jgi:adenylate kinase
MTNQPKTDNKQRHMMLYRLEKLIRYIQIYHLVSAPAAGKTTLLKMIAALGAHFRIHTIPTSIKILEHVNSTPQTSLGGRLQPYVAGMRKRELVPCELILELIETEIVMGYERGANIFFVDGTPRTVLQGRKIVETGVPSMLFELNLELEEILRRDAERSKTEKRIDHGQIARGLEVYEKQTRPVIDFYKRLGRHRQIKAALPMRSKINHTLRNMGLRRQQREDITAQFDIPGHPARILLEEIEGPQPQNETDRTLWPGTQEQRTMAAMPA